MFEGDLETLTTTELLESAAEHYAAQQRIEARRLEHAQLFADRSHPSARPRRHRPDGTDAGRERGVVLGGEGCPEIAEFAAAEFGAVNGVSPGAAAAYIGNALALRHRFPHIWAKVQAGQATPWRACKIATACLHLTEDAAAVIDERLARVVDTVTPLRLEKIVKAAEAHAAPAAARAKAEQHATERGVFVGRSDDYGSKKIFIRAPSGHVIRFNATLNSIANALKLLGDPRSAQARRAEAIGIIADPCFTEELLLQARHQHLTTPTATDPADDTRASTNAGNLTPASGPDRSGAPGQTGAPGQADDPGPDRASNADRTNDADRTRDAGRSGDVVRTDGAGRSDDPDHPDGAGCSDDPDHPDGASRTNWLNLDGGPGSDHGSGQDDGFGLGEEPGVDDEADRDAPHPSQSHLVDPLDLPRADPVEPFDPVLCNEPTDGQPLDPTARRALHTRLIQIKHDAYAHRSTRPPQPPPGGAIDIGGVGSVAGDGGSLGHRPATSDPRNTVAGHSTAPTHQSPDHEAADHQRAGHRATGPRAKVSRLRPGGTEIYVHLTDHTLATGTGVLRAETLGPLLAEQLTELIGHAPYTVKPVIDLNKATSVDAYEIPDHIRERVKLTHPVEVFPYGNHETTNHTDLDHIHPYNPDGPPGQTGTDNLAPLGRFSHRVKTHAHGWHVHRLDPTTIEWTTPHGFTYHVTPDGTIRANRQPPDPDCPT